MDLDSRKFINQVKEGCVDYYAVLNCAPDSDMEELKRNYKTLVLRYHPDKCNGVESEGYLLLNQVWKTLSDPLLKKQYDEQLKLTSTYPSHVIYDTLSLDDLVCDSVSGLYTYNCRCGGVYQIGTTEIKKGDTVIPCEDCSMAILVKRREQGNISPGVRLFC